MQLIDKYLPQWDISKKNVLTASSDKTADLSVIYRADFTKSFIIKALFALRGLPKEMMTIKGIIHSGFILLEENGNELVIGLIAQPWKLTGNILRMSPEQFLAFDQAGFVKVAWNFTMEQQDQGKTTICTETRIQSTSAEAKRFFSMYWLLIGFFSGVIRNEMLKLIRDEITA